MSDLPTIRRQLNIKSGVAKRYVKTVSSNGVILKEKHLFFLALRLAKENQLYIKEAEDQKRKLDGLVAAGSEGWDINNGVRVHF
jgi:tubulin-specific chaperone A